MRTHALYTLQEAMAKIGPVHRLAWPHPLTHPRSDGQSRPCSSTRVNVRHGVEPLLRGRGKHAHLRLEGPVLELAPGVGNNGLYLAIQAGVQYYYAGLSLLETSFAQFRAAKRGLGPERFRVLPPYSPTDWKLDPLAALRPDAEHHGKIGIILAFDVLEHVPRFEATVAALVAALRPGGMIIEQSPFAEDDAPNAARQNGTDTRLHVSRGGVTMEQAMGPRMKQTGGNPGTGTRVWRKRGLDGQWKDTCCISGFSSMCHGWQKRCKL